MMESIEISPEHALDQGGSRTADFMPSDHLTWLESDGTEKSPSFSGVIACYSYNYNTWMTTNPFFQVSVVL